MSNILGRPRTKKPIVDATRGNGNYHTNCPHCGVRKALSLNNITNYLLGSKCEIRCTCKKSYLVKRNG